MKTQSVFFILLLQAGTLFAQTSPAPSSTLLANIIKGNYTPTTYQASTVITDPTVVSQGLLNEISADSLKATLFKLKNFQNRNMFSDTVSNTRGIGATRRWVLSKFQQYSAANDNRLQAGYLWFNYGPSNSSVGCPNSVDLITKHADIIAVLPGSQTSDKSLIIVEGHVDSRNDSLCSLTTNAFGVGDNATGAALVMELARVMSKYTFKNTIIFAVVTGEEQGLIGAKALANYIDGINTPIKAVNNNDVSGGIFCGHTASAPGCPGYGQIDSTDLRIFSLGGFNAPCKQWARYVKLEYKEQLLNSVAVPVNIQIMSPEDRTGRGGDHQAFTKLGFTGIRFTQAYEDGDASNGPGYKDRQHNIRDSLGRDTDHDGVEDTLYVDVDYLARNTLINGNSMAMVALGPDTITVDADIMTSNRFRVQFTPTGAAAYRVAVRSATNDWDTVYTITGKNVDTITVPYATNTQFYLSAAAVDANGTESQFSTEYKMSTELVVLALPPDSTRPAPPPPTYYGIQLMPNKPNPFDEATMITIQSGTDLFVDRTLLTISTIDGRPVQRIRVPLKKGLNEVLFDHGYLMPPGVYVCSLIIDGLPVQSTKMVFRPM
jgi:hypothetical protein